MNERNLKDVEKKRLKEQETVELMIKLYCKGNHGGNTENTYINGLCPDCLELAEYSKARSENCPFMENKTFCNNCKVHCYKPEMREKIKKVMRYSGPRMMFYHPIMAMEHAYYSMMEKKKLNKNKRS